jgi:Ser-tRNA(Ala) deacylase AlaX
MQDGLALCQHDSMLREANVRVISCEKAEEKKPLGAWKVVTDDTVLFPEGGGQPWDLGTLGGVAVHGVTRKDKTGTVIHHCASNFEGGLA